MPEKTESDNDQHNSVDESAYADKIDPVTKTTDSHTAHDQSEPRKSMTGFEIAQVLQGVIAALLAGLGLLILSKQNTILNRQTEVMAKQTEIMGRQTTLMREASKQTDEQSKRSLEISVFQSKAALDQSIEASRIDQRAWLGVKHMKMITLEMEKPVTVEAVVVNTGKTFALDSRFLVTVAVHAGPPLDVDRAAASPERLAKQFPERPYVVFPGVEVTARATRSVTGETIARIKDGMVTVYFFGELSYTDIFQRPHRTEFCGIYSPPSNVPLRPGWTGQWG